MSKRQHNRMVLGLRRAFKQKGRPMSQAVDYAVRQGLRRQAAICAARVAYGAAPPRRKFRLVQGGRVSPAVTSSE